MARDDGDQVLNVNDDMWWNGFLAVFPNTGAVTSEHCERVVTPFGAEASVTSR
jgi:hypothetical protein